MKKLFKKLAGLMMGLLAVAGLAGFNASNSVVASAANTTDDSQEKWSVIGSINGTSWDKDFPLSYVSDNDRYEIKISLNKDECFKIRLNNSWSTQIGYKGNTGANIGTYLTYDGSGDYRNFKVKTTGVYILWVKDDHVANYGDKSYGFGIDPVVSNYYTVTHYKKDGSVLSDGETVLENSLYNPKFEEEEGFRLEGWYTEPELINKFEKATAITTDLNLYPKYVEAEDYTAYFYDSNDVLGSKVYAYMYRDSTDGGKNAEWPGIEMEKDANGCWKIEIDVSQTYTKIIFNGNGAQTDNIEIIDKPLNVYVMGEKKEDSSRYDASINTVIAAIKGENSVSETGYYLKDSEGNLTNGASFIANEQKQMAFEQYMTNVDTCTSYDNVAEYNKLAEGLDTSAIINDEDGENNTIKVSIADKLAYMEIYKASKDAEKGTSGINILGNISSSNNIAIILVVGLLGLTAVGAYYFINKKKYA